MSRLHRYLCVFAVLVSVSTAYPAELTFQGTGIVKQFPPAEMLQVTTALFVDADGTVSRGSTKPEKLYIDGEKHAVVGTYPWGTVTLHLRTRDDHSRLDANYTVTNRSDKTLKELHLSGLPFRAEGVRRIDSGGHNVGAPTVIGVWAKDRNFAVCNEQIDRPLNLAVRKGRDGVLAVQIRAGGDRMVHDNLFLRRPIAAGESDQYRITVRSGDANTSPHDLGDDIYRKFAAAHPRLLDWPDRRPVARLFFGGGWEKEKIIAWFKDPNSIELPTKVSEKRREQILNKVRSGVEAAKAIDAQALIFWDIEGGTFPHATTYIGDPRLTKVFNPEVDLVADEMFKLVTDANLHAGVCLRPSQIVYEAEPNTVAQRYGTVLSKYKKDPVFNQLNAKIEYCKKRWGVTVYYVDTNIFYRPYGPKPDWKHGLIQAEVWKKLVEKHPDILIIPEFTYPECLAYVANYTEYDMGYRGLPESSRRIYPEAFSVAVIEDADPYEKFDLMVRNVRQGDTLMTFTYGLTRNAMAATYIFRTAELLDAGTPKAVTEADNAQLAKLLDSDDAAVAFHAARALGEAQPVEDKNTREAVSQALRAKAADANAEFVIRKGAVEALGHRKDARSVPVLVDLLDNTRPDLRYFAAEALGRIGRPALTTLLAREVISPYGIEAIGRIGDPNATQRVVDMLGDERYHRQERTIIKALGRLGGPKAAAALIDVLNGKSKWLAVSAAEALGQIGTPQAVEALKARRELEQKAPKDDRHNHLIWKIGQVLNAIGQR